MTALKAVPDDGVDLSEFGQRIDVGEKRWAQVVDQLTTEDERKFRAALLEPAISATAIVSWLERRKIGVHRATVVKWRTKGYATL